MKKLIILFLLLGFFLGGLHAQKFFAPVPKDYFAKNGTKAIVGSHEWLIRPQLGVIGVIWNWDKETKQFYSQAFDWIGLGVGYELFRPTSESDPTPYSLVGLNALIVFGPVITGAVTIKALGIINAGVCYNKTNKFGLLTGIQFRF